MQEEAARKLIEDTFKQPYDLGRFRAFVREFMQMRKGDERETSGIVPDNFEGSIKSVYRIGTIKDDDNNEIDLLAVTLARETSLDRARTLQRNFMARHLSKRDKEAALVAFVSPESSSWRFSLVRRELSLTKSLRGKTRALQNFSPARRFSFLVGGGEKTHTVKRQLLRLLTGDDRPTLKKLEEAFNIETVTDEFFKEYRKLFDKIEETISDYLKSNSNINKHFEEKDITSADFAKRLMGQIVFLYFLQKKGWLGVPRGKKWGEGSPRFLRDLFKDAKRKNKNFFNEYLEPLFYQALNRDHSDEDHYHELFKCRIPFLNGGLFEPYHNYDWIEHDINLPNTIFSEPGSSLFGDDGRGILDVFDRYNFTVAEDEPLEREVAIDPEMLGKVFENLLGVQDRKQKGTYYTPREIVHYMCQESLIAHLQTRFPNIGQGNLEDFIRYGDLYLEYDTEILKRQSEGIKPTRDYSKCETPISIRENASELDEALATVKVCDPAIGSGAFPVGMMTEIIRARRVLALHMRLEHKAYDLKRQTIQDCLYGVDLDPGAIEIAKLRLWLSLVVDEDDFNEIQALPNLDYKIMQGNSLLQTYEGIRLFEDSLLKSHDNAIRRKKQLQSELESLQSAFKTMRGTANFVLSAEQKKAFETDIKKKETELTALERTASDDPLPLLAGQSRAVELAERLKALHTDFFRAARPTEKRTLREQIENLEWQLIETSLKEQHKTDKLDAIRKLQRANVKPYFLWKLHFSEVFSGENGGFDIVIANPPYVRADGDERHAQMRKAILDSGCYETLWEKWDLFVPFIELGYKLLKPDGVTTMIVSDAFCHSKYAQKSQNWFLKNARILRLDFCSDLKFFEAAVHNLIYFFQNADGTHQTPERRVHRETFGNVAELPSEEQEKLTYRAFFPEEVQHAGFSNPTLPIGEICYLSYGLAVSSDEKEHKGEFVTEDVVQKDRDTKHPKPWIEGKLLAKWLPLGNRWLEWGTVRAPGHFRRVTFEELYEVPEKILIMRVAGGDLRCCFDDQKLYTNTPRLLLSHGTHCKVFGTNHLRNPPTIVTRSRRMLICQNEKSLKRPAANLL